MTCATLMHQLNINAKAIFEIQSTDESPRNIEINITVTLRSSNYEHERTVIMCS